MVREYNFTINFTKNTAVLDSPLKFVEKDNITSVFNVTVEDLETGEIILGFKTDSNEFAQPISITNHQGSYKLVNSILTGTSVYAGFKYIGTDEEILTINKRFFAKLDEKISTGEEPTPEEASVLEKLIAQVNELNVETKEAADLANTNAEYAKEQGQNANEIYNTVKTKLENGELNGKDGAKGDTGETGPKGETGATGPKGEDAKINGINTISIISGDNIVLKQVNSNLTISAIKQTDNNYTTEEKEKLASLMNYDDTSVKQSIDTINSKIPTQATSDNQLADKEFVNSSLNSITAYYITKDENGSHFSSKAELDSTTTFYSGGVVRVPTRNDYCIVQVDETKDNATTRYIYQNNGWEYQYTVNETALTSDQIKALNSGITSELVAKLNGIDMSQKQDVITDLETIRSGASKGATALQSVPSEYAKISDIPTNVSQLTNDKGYITGYTETDPVFSASASAGITSSDIANWNSKVSPSGVPTKTSELTNDSDFLNTTQVQALIDASVNSALEGSY